MPKRHECFRCVIAKKYMAGAQTHHPFFFSVSFVSCMPGDATSRFIRCSSARERLSFRPPIRFLARLCFLVIEVAPSLRQTRAHVFCLVEQRCTLKLPLGRSKRS